MLISRNSSRNSKRQDTLYKKICCLQNICKKLKKKSILIFFYVIYI